MHIRDLPQPLQNKLANAGTEISPIVMITVTTLQAMPNGSYGPAFATYRFDISDRLLEDPRITIERSRWPDDGDFLLRAIECTLRFDNSDRIFAVAQGGAILRAEDIEQSIVDIYADVGGTVTNWFSGRVVGRPTERAGETTFVVSGHIWEAIRKTVLYENFGTVFHAGKFQTQSVVGGLSGFGANTVHIECIGQHFCAHHGLVAFDGGGNYLPRFTKTGGTIELLTMRLSNRLKLGKYTLKFTSHSGYTLTCPSNVVYSGNRFRGIDPLSPVQIGRDDWAEGGDGLGCIIEFYVSWAAYGNGIAMVYNHLEKALLDNQGALPDNTPSVRLDRATFVYWAQRFASFPIHVDVTNENNDSLNGDDRNRPVEYGDLVERILAHYQCSLTMLPDGTISISGPYMDDRPSYPHDTATAILKGSLELQGGDTVNYLTIQYGGDTDGGFSAPIIRNLNPNAAQRVEKIFTLPWIKVGIGDRHASWWEKMIVRRYMRKQTLVKYTVDMGNGLLLAAGDRITVESPILPILSQRCEIIQVTRSIGDVTEVLAAMVQDGEGPQAIVGVSRVSEVGVW